MKCCRFLGLCGLLLPAVAAQAQSPPDGCCRAAAHVPGARFNVRDFGARGDGRADDSAAFGAATAEAIAHPADNGAAEIDIPAGRYLLRRSWVITFGRNTALRLHGDGASLTALQFEGGIDGIRATFAPNPTGNELSRQKGWPGQGLEVDGIHFIADGAGREAGTALSVTGIPLVNASNPPFQTYRDLQFSNAGGWTDRATNWAGAISLQDPDNALIDHVQFWDHDLLDNRVTVAIRIHSTAPAAGPGHGNITVSNALVGGGDVAVAIDGNAIQDVNLSHLATVGVHMAVRWVVPPNTLSGSLTIDHGSLGADRGMVELGNVSTVFSDHNFYYNTAPTPGQDPVFFQSEGGDTIVSTGDQFVGPQAGAMGPGHHATAMFVASPTRYDPQGSSVTGDTVAGFDLGYGASGGPIAFNGDAAASSTATCYRDTGTQADGRMRPSFAGMSCGDRTVWVHDGAAPAKVLDAAPAPAFWSGITLGAPGVTSPGGAHGAAGTIELRGTPSRDGTLAGLVGHDARLVVGPGDAAGRADDQGPVDLYARWFRMHGPVLAAGLRYTGFVAPANAGTACTEGDSGDATVSGVPYHFYCYAPNRWSRVALATGW